MDKSRISLKVSNQKVARSTKWYWQQREKKKTTGHFVKEYERRRQHLTYNCGKCGKPRTRDTHNQYYRHWFCPFTANKTNEPVHEISNNVTF